MATHAQRRLRMIIALSLLLVLLLATIGFIQLREQPAPTITSTNEVARIQIERPQRATIVLQRTGDKWWITEPYRLLANAQRIEPLLGALSSADTGYTRDEVDIAATGLDQPQALVSIDTRLYTLGDKDVSGERRYAQLDERVILVPEWVLSLVNGGVTAFADLRIFIEPIHSLQLVSSDAQPRTLEHANWQELTARQIVDWPIDDMPTITHQARLTVHTANDDARDVELLFTERYAALHVLDASYAYIVELTDLPEDAKLSH